jgi:hypothetical protein
MTIRGVKPRQCSWLVRCCAFMCFSVLGASTAHAQAVQERLVGLRTVAAVVLFQATDSAPSGVSKDRLRTVLELRLRSAGLGVMSEEESLRTGQRSPYVLLDVMYIGPEDQLGGSVRFIYRIDLSARVFAPVPSFGDSLAVRRPNLRAPLVLWSTASIGVDGVVGAPTRIEETVNEMLDSFLKAWLDANPKR